MASISIDGTHLTIEVHGVDRLWALKGRLTIPLDHVRGATADPGMTNEPKGLRGPGTHLTGVIVAGTFHQDGQKVFWDVHDHSKAVVIELQDDTYQRLVVEVDDPKATVELITRTITQP